MLKKVQSMLFYAGTDYSSISRVVPRILQTNRMMMTTLSICATVFIGVLLIFSFYLPDLETSRPVYTFGLVSSIILFILSMFARKCTWVITPMGYLAISVYYICGILNGIVADPEGKTVTFMVMLVLMPILIQERPMRIALLQVIHVSIFCYLCLKFKTGETQTVDIIDAIAYGIMGAISGATVNHMKVRGYISERKIQDISRHDQLTEVYNRNAYELDLYSVSERCKHSLACVYIDVNGLHEINNVEGHNSGDAMLKFVAKQIKEVFTTGRVYRTGGDEFVVFIPDMERAETGFKVAELAGKVEEGHYHIAVGYETAGCRHLLIDDLVEAAETRMFADKDRFYKNVPNRDIRRKTNSAQNLEAT